MKVYLDDERATPDGWTRIYWPQEAIPLLQSGKVTHISLDHDLGDDERGTGNDVVLWIEEAVFTQGFQPPIITVHSANSSARNKMELGINNIYKQANITMKSTPVCINRPDPSVACILAAATRVAARVNEDADDIVDSFEYGDGGYDLARKLDDDHSWHIDADTVSELEEMNSHVEDLYKAELAQWMIDENVQPPFENGDQIKQGVIKGICEYTPACFKVQAHGCTDPNRSTIIKFEDARAA
jgi:hypothetical protein